VLTPVLTPVLSFLSSDPLGHLIKKDNTGVNTGVDTGDNTGLNPFHRVTHCRYHLGDIGRQKLSVNKEYGMSSGITRLGVTRGGKWPCHPYFSFKRAGDLFQSSLRSDDLFSCRLVTTPQLSSSDIVLPTILCKFGHNFFSLGCHPPGWYHPGRSAPSP